MPIHDILCTQCNYSGEAISLNADIPPCCPECGAVAQTLISATSTLTGKTRQHVPGPGDTACCGSAPGHSGCAGPGSCCGTNA